MGDNDAWFTQMSQAVRGREIALAGRARWQRKVDAAETAVAVLAAQRDTVSPAPDAAVQQQEVDSAIAAPVRPVFGISTPQD